MIYPFWNLKEQEVASAYLVFQPKGRRSAIEDKSTLVRQLRRVRTIPWKKDTPTSRRYYFTFVLVMKTGEQKEISCAPYTLIQEERKHAIPIGHYQRLRKLAFSAWESAYEKREPIYDSPINLCKLGAGFPGLASETQLKAKGTNAPV